MSYSSRRFNFINAWHSSGERVDLVKQHGTHAFVEFAKRHFQGWLSAVLPVGLPIRLSHAELVDLCELLWACGKADDASISEAIKKMVEGWRLVSPSDDDLQAALAAMPRQVDIRPSFKFEGERGSGRFRVYVGGFRQGEVLGGRNRWCVEPARQGETFYISGSRVAAARALYWEGIKTVPPIEIAQRVSAFP